MLAQPSLLRLLLLTAVLVFARLGSYGLMDVDEPRNAGCAAEMWARHDWIVPTFNDELRPHKPALTYWLMMSAYAVFGVNEFSARLGSALLGLGSVGLTYGIGRRLFDAATGYWAGLLLATSLFFLVAARISTPDAPLIFTVTLTMYAFVRAAWPQRPPSPDRTTSSAPPADGHFPTSWWAGAGIYGAMGLAVLAKGPVGWVLPTAIIGLHQLISRQSAQPPVPPLPNRLHALVRAGRNVLRWFAPVHFLRTCWRLRPLTAIVVVLAIAGPWFWAVHVATNGEFTRGFFFTHNLERATRSMEGHGGPALLYYPLIVFVAFFPASCFLVPALRDAFARIAAHDAMRSRLVFLSCWAGVWIGAFSIASTKLPSYITPAYPALALIVAAALGSWQRATGRWTQRSLAGAWWGLIGVGAVIAVGLAVATHLIFGTDAWVGLVGLVPIVGGGLGLRRLNSGQRTAALAHFALTAALTSGLLLDGVLPYLSRRHQRGPELLALAQAHTRDRARLPQLYAFGALEPSFVFNARRPVPLFERTEGAALRTALLAKDTFVLVRDRDGAALTAFLPSDFAPLGEVTYFGRPDLRLRLYGRPRRDTQSLPAIP